MLSSNEMYWLGQRSERKRLTGYYSKLSPKRGNPVYRMMRYLTPDIDDSIEFLGRVNVLLATEKRYLDAPEHNRYKMGWDGWRLFSAQLLAEQDMAMEGK